MRLILALCLSLFVLQSFGQQAEEPVDSVKAHVRGATIRAAVVPGWGQLYNRKYWKAPIVWAGVGTCAFFISDNLSNLDTYKTGLIADQDDDPATTNTTGYNTAQLESLVETYTRWRDLSFMALGLVYVLNIVDAHVDAHLFYFDVGKELSLNWRPNIWTGYTPSAGISLSLGLR